MNTDRVNAAIDELQNALNEMFEDPQFPVAIAGQGKAAMASAIEGLKMAVSLFTSQATTPTQPPEPTVEPLIDTSTTHDMEGPGDD